MMGRPLWILLASSLLCACTSPPVLQANWHIIHPDPPDIPIDDAPGKGRGKEKEESPSQTIASANLAREAPFTYDELRKKTQMVIVILNRGKHEIALRKIAVNMNLKEPMIDQFIDTTRNRVRLDPIPKSSLPEANSALTFGDQPYWLPPGGLHVIDVTPLAVREGTDKDEAKLRGGTLRCQIPLWLYVEYDGGWPKISTQTLQLKLPSPMPSALPEGWEHCGSRLAFAAPKASSASSAAP